MSLTKPTLIIAISGPSSSGKSTLSRLLRSVYPNSFILHQDDFYLSDDKIPMRDGNQDWDCPEAFDFDSFCKVLDQIKSTGKVPVDFKSIEETQAIGESGVEQEYLDTVIKPKLGLISSNSGSTNELQYSNICFVDGLMLYHNEELCQRFDKKFFIRAEYSVLKARREARMGYATLQGFWIDPPNYFENYVWGGYQRTHSHLFINGDVNGDLDSSVLKKADIAVPPSMDMTMKQLLDWITEELKNILVSV
ncbi:P-loop containing nucleoside triphosphate hydrolase protein [Nadsonia fulvescens var. elongata DSM 6958]|uniref:p-loop containing nucleoside triphosphate hydrolase protein n=1 Tax=Nadsonia fulvescens var. elongata DSM 6958 TaxID=857566 RepID=A0A1E3PS13_9ASCO|nr:P-loop containing nucleoside triphosphate hydrolase protein [Nadsonia fulvescens var. elongata DSM 6958]